MDPDDEDQARSLGSKDAIELRRGMIHHPHVKPLTEFVRALETSTKKDMVHWEFPYFDPLDGGIEADILFLFEKPGPKTSKAGGGSGFISRNNDDPTAEATFNFMKEAEIPRRRTVIWNAVPGWNGQRRVSGKELREGIGMIDFLLELLPEVRTVVLVGRKAQRAAHFLKKLDRPARPLRVFTSAHPSPIVFATRPEEWLGIPFEWRKAAYS